MKNTSRLLKSAVLAGAVALAACSTAPTVTPTLEQARDAFVAANNNPQVVAYAPNEFAQATAALNQANAAAAKREDAATVERLAYLAKQRIAIAQEVAQAKAAEAKIAQAAQQRNEVRLEAREAEAERARREAEAARMRAMSAQQQAEYAQQQAQQAQTQAALMQQQNAMLAQRTAQLESQLNELQAKKTERGYIVTIGDVFFAVDQASLRPTAMASLRKLADVLAQNPNRTVLVEGFTDSTGSDEYNLRLSERRADAVAQALAQMGVPRDRIDTRAYGEAFPVVPNDTAGNRQLNRRVEIVLSNEGEQIPPRAR